MVVYHHMPIGFHVSKNAAGKKTNMYTALLAAIDTLKRHKFAQLAAQIFVSGPQSFRETLSDADKQQINTISDLTLVVHGAYVDNPWSGSTGSIHNIRQELRIAHEIGAIGVVIHLSKAAIDGGNVARVLQSVAKDMPNEILQNTILWLETHTAKSAPETYETPAKIRALFERVQASASGLRVGLCVDSAHVFASGFSFAEHDATLQWLTDLPDVPIMFHLNDSASTLGSGKDQHAALCMGNIWRDFHPVTGTREFKSSGLHAILEWTETKGHVVILERNQDLHLDLTMLERLNYF